MPSRHCILDAPAIIITAIVLLSVVGWIGWALILGMFDLARFLLSAVPL